MSGWSVTSLARVWPWADSPLGVTIVCVPCPVVTLTPALQQRVGGAPFPHGAQMEARPDLRSRPGKGWGSHGFGGQGAVTGQHSGPRGRCVRRPRPVRTHDLCSSGAPHAGLSLPCFPEPPGLPTSGRSPLPVPTSLFSSANARPTGNPRPSDAPTSSVCGGPIHRIGLSVFLTGDSPGVGMDPGSQGTHSG